MDPRSVEELRRNQSRARCTTGEPAQPCMTNSSYPEAFEADTYPSAALPAGWMSNGVYSPRHSIPVAPRDQPYIEPHLLPPQLPTNNQWLPQLDQTFDPSSVANNGQLMNGLPHDEQLNGAENAPCSIHHPPIMQVQNLCPQAASGLPHHHVFYSPPKASTGGAPLYFNRPMPTPTIPSAMNDVYGICAGVQADKNITQEEEEGQRQATQNQGPVSKVYDLPQRKRGRKRGGQTDEQEYVLCAKCREPIKKQ